MRTKITVLAAAALAVGVTGASAQVYSQNIVGYVNVVLKGGGKYTLVANPLDNGSGNVGTNLVDPAGLLPNKSQILTWNGATFTTATKQQGVWNSNPTLAPGTGFFVFLPTTQTTDVTNTFVGNVAVSSGGSITNVIQPGFSLVGSPIPLSGDLTTSTQLGSVGALLAVNKSQILTWNGSTYNTATLQQGAWNATANVNVGDGFFINSKNAGPTNWVQSLP